MSEFDHAQVMNRCAEKAWAQGIDSLSEEERVVALVSIVNSEVELGGFSTLN